MIGVLILGPLLLGLNVIDSLIVGSVIAAVSPAVVVPRMIKLIENHKGEKHHLPELILAGASLDDIYVIIVFTALLEFAKKESISWLNFVNVPMNLVLGITIGIVIGYIFVRVYTYFKLSNDIVVLLLMGLSFLLLRLQDFVSFSALLAIMVMAMVIKFQSPKQATKLSLIYNKLWLVAEIILFVLVGISLNVMVALNYGVMAILLVILAPLFRMLGVYLSVLKTKINRSEKLFLMLAYMPKATVQASIGGIPLAMGLACGNIVLTIAVLSILITAPLGAFCIDYFSDKLLVD